MAPPAQTLSPLYTHLATGTPLWLLTPTYPWRKGRPSCFGQGCPERQSLDIGGVQGQQEVIRGGRSMGGPERETREKVDRQSFLLERFRVISRMVVQRTGPGARALGRWRGMRRLLNFLPSLAWGIALTVC